MLKNLLESLNGTYINDKLASVKAKAATHKMSQYFAHFLTKEYIPDTSNYISKDKENNMDDNQNTYSIEYTDSSNNTVTEDNTTAMVTPENQQQVSTATQILYTDYHNKEEKHDRIKHHTN